MKRQKSDNEHAVAYDAKAELSAQERNRLPLLRMQPQEVPERRMVSMRLRDDTVRQLKEIARQKAVPYQVLIQMWLQERLQIEMMPQGQKQTLLRQLTTQLQQLVYGLETGSNEPLQVGKKSPKVKSRHKTSGNETGERKVRRSHTARAG